MILKKPYRFLIKHFRFIHIILFFLGMYLVRKSNLILSFFNEYVESTSLVSVVNLKNNLFDSLMFVLCVIIILILFIIFFLLKKKEKIYKFYLFSIIFYIITFVFFYFVSEACETLQKGVLDVRIIKIINDVSLFVFVFQLIYDVFFLMKGLGFNIRKFNFDSYNELGLSDEDSEEVEVEIDVDTNKFVRNLKRSKRYIRYTYKENKFFINVLIVILIVTGIFGTYYYKNFVNKIYKENEFFNVDGLKINISESYITDSGYNNKKITENKLIVVKLNMQSIGVESVEFNDAKVLLFVDDIPFNSNQKYNKNLIDIGDVYKNKKISKDSLENYLLVFEMPNNYSKKDMNIVYSYGNNQNIKINIKPKEINEVKNNSVVNLNGEMDIDSSLFKKTKLTIYDYELSEKFKLKYNFKGYDGAYYYSYEYLRPEYTDNYEKVLLKLSCEFDSEQIKFGEFVEKFSTIEYKINGVNKTMNTKVSNIKPKKYSAENDFYFSVYEEIKDAEEINLVFNLRGNVYKYKLK